MSLLIFFALFGISAAECPDSWFSLGKYCYHISTARLDWGTSEEYCWNAGGYLAEFESLEDEKAVATMSLPTQTRDLDSQIILKEIKIVNKAYRDFNGKWNDQ